MWFGVKEMWPHGMLLHSRYSEKAPDRDQLEQVVMRAYAWLWRFSLLGVRVAARPAL
jgi:hypothetical protein